MKAKNSTDINNVKSKTNNNKQKSSRKLKVYEKHFSRSYYKFVVFPEIRLSGKWLNEIGFICGESINVYLQKNKIIITVK